MIYIRIKNGKERCAAVTEIKRYNEPGSQWDVGVYFVGEQIPFLMDYSDYELITEDEYNKYVEEQEEKERIEAERADKACCCKSVDWSKFRRDAAVNILAGFAAKNGLNCTANPIICSYAAVELADALIDELRKEE